MAQIILENPSLGGIADTKYLGAPNSMAALVGLDLHSEPGVIKVNQKMTKESGTTVDALVNAIVPCSDGNSYLFGANGKIWKRTSGGTYSLLATVAPASGAAAVFDAREYQGYIYYSMPSRLGRKILPGAADWSDREDNFATWGNSDQTYHPMQEVNLILFLGDANYVAQVDGPSGHVFTATALDIKKPLRIQSLMIDDIELLIGAFTGNNVNDTEAIRWNTWSPSFSSSDQLPEVGITSFLPIDNAILAWAGNKGNIYQYNGGQMISAKRVPGDWSTYANRATVTNNAVANRLGITLFGISNLNGNPIVQGVYSFGRYGPTYPMILNLEHLISTGVSTGLTIGAMAFIPGTGSVADTLLVSWFDGTNYGVDALDATAKMTGAYMDSRIVATDRDILKQVSEITACYRTLPAGTSFKFYVSKNHGAFTEITDQLVDSMRQTVSTTVRVEECSSFQVRVEFVPSGNTAPELEKVIIKI